MQRPKPTHCLRGHEYTPETSVWSTSNHGKPQRSCRTCRNMRLRLKYQTNEAFRQKRLVQVAAYKQEIKVLAAGDAR